MKKLIFAASAAAAMFAFSCKSTEAPVVQSQDKPKEEETAVKKYDIASLDGEWKVSSLKKNGESKTVAEADMTLTELLAGSYSVSGFSGVNRYNGKISVANDGTFKETEPFASTKMAGPEELMNFEDVYLNVLLTSDKIQLTDHFSKLRVYSSKEDSEIIFVKK